MKDLLQRPGQGGELLPRHVPGQPRAHALLHRLAAGHRYARRGAVGKVIALREQLPMAFGERRLLLLEPFDQSGEVFFGGGNRSRSAHQQRGGERSQDQDQRIPQTGFRPPITLSRMTTTAITSKT